VELGLYTDSVSRLDFEQALDFAVSIGASAVEIAAGGQSSAPHMKVFDLIGDAGLRRDYADQITGRGLRLAAINCSAWPTHPLLGDEHAELMRAAVRLAEQLGTTKIVTMSGCPGDSTQSRLFNWIAYPWPSDAVAIRDGQWEQSVAFWREFAEFAAAHGIERIALELHPLQLVYNVPTLLSLRDRIGPIIGANVDPSHMFWQQMDPIACLHALGSAVYHVHLKDVQFEGQRLALAGVLDGAPWAEPERRAWIFRTVGRGHDASFWRGFLKAADDIGYDDALSIENEDPVQNAQEGVREAASFIAGLLDEQGGGRR